MICARAQPTAILPDELLISAVSNNILLIRARLTGHRVYLGCRLKSTRGTPEVEKLLVVILESQGRDEDLSGECVPAEQRRIERRDAEN